MSAESFSFVKDLRLPFLIVAAAALAGGLNLGGCAGRPAEPVSVYRPGDLGLSCEGLAADLVQIDVEVARLMPQADKSGQNAAALVTGAFLLFPLFFLDLSDAEKIEVRTLRLRHNRLLDIARKKGCGIDRQPMPELFRSQ